MEEKIERIFEKGKMKGTTWQFDNIKVGHAISSFRELTSFTSGNEDELVRLHFGLKGDYRFSHQQLGKSFDLIGGHHNIMYSKGFNMTVENS